MTIAAICTEPN